MKREERGKSQVPTKVISLAAETNMIRRDRRTNGRHYWEKKAGARKGRKKEPGKLNR